MKKDIEWLKKEIATEMIELEPNRKERWSDVRYQTLRNVAQKIDQLDELKVLSQEWVDNNVVHVRGLGDIFEAVAVESLLVPKRELPVIPQFVADWWDGDSVTMYGGESINKKYKLRLISEFHDRGLGDYLSKVEDWLDENNSAFLDLVNGKPYEIEKEKLYYIKFSENQYAQRFDESKIDSILVNDKAIAGRFTKEEIEKMNSNFMALAAEVAE